MRHRDLYIRQRAELEMPAEQTGEYGIQVDWKSGDSFGETSERDEIILPWKNIEVAKKNAERLASHVCMYNNLENAYTGKSRKEILEKWAKADWAVITDVHPKFALTEKLENGKFICVCSIKLLTDDGDEFQISADNWLGSFESNQKFEAMKILECFE